MCLCTTLQNRQTQKLHLVNRFHVTVVAVSKMGVARLFSLYLGQKSMASIAWVFFYPSKRYLLSDVLWVTLSPFSRTAHLRMGRVIQSNSCSVKHLILFLQSYGSQQSKPDLGVMQRCVYQMQIHNVDKVKQRLVDVWSILQQSVVDAVVIEYRKRLQACVCINRDISNICSRLFW